MYEELSVFLSISINRSRQANRACRVLYGTVMAVQKAAEGFGGRGGGMSHLRRVEGFLEHKAPGLGAEDQEGKF